jgi:SAM-dependent methyltransferase
MIDPMAWSYEHVATTYEASRPSYPPAAIAELVDRLSIRSSSVLADVGAGTGKFTRLLVPTGAFIVAVEPVPAMRIQLAHAVPEVSIVGAAAGALPFADAGIDAITVAQAFHWFANDETVTEFARVLAGGGGLGLIWNRRDRSLPVWRDIEDVIGPHRPARSADWREPLADAGFTPLRHASFTRTYTARPDRVRSRIASMSWIAGLDAETRTGLLDEVDQIARRHASNGLVAMSEDTDVYWAHKL